MLGEGVPAALRGKRNVDVRKSCDGFQTLPPSRFSSEPRVVASY